MAANTAPSAHSLWGDTTDSRSFDEALRALKAGDSLEGWFKEDPLAYWSRHISLMIRDLSATPEAKVRVPVSSPRQMLSFSRFLPLCFDLAVFSPSLAWPTRHVEPCCEFATSHTGLDSIHVMTPLVELFAWLVAARPLLERRRVAFLPICGASPHRWANDVLSSEPRLEELDALGNLRDNEIASAVAAFWEDLQVSFRLGCRHLLIWPDLPPIVLHPHSLYRRSKKYAFLPVRVPRAGGMKLNEFAALLDNAQGEIQRFRAALADVQSRVASLLNDSHDVVNRIGEIKSEYMLPASAAFRSAVESLVPPRSPETNVTWEKVFFQVLGPANENMTDNGGLDSAEPVSALLDLARSLSEYICIPEASIFRAIRPAVGARPL